MMKTSRKKAKGLLDRGQVRVNGRKVVIASWAMTAGDRIEIEEGSEETQVPANKYFLKVIFEDPHVIVVEKEAGIPCEISPVSTRPTLVSIINAYFKRRLPDLKHHYLGLIHRLDTETSGLMVYSKTREANKLTDQFKRHAIRRKYVAVVEGRIDGGGGQIEGYLQKSDLLRGGQKVKLSTPESGRHALTHFKVIERYANSTLVEITLNTGRTHQIRVHMASIGHRVVGDKIYGPHPASGHPLPQGERAFPRQSLHASFLGFHHPITGQKMEFESELPRDMRRLIDRLRVCS